ncbi:MAG: hydrogenase expression/formation protein HypE [bacterium]|nr:hydrogenase expression/formation protein HypE [bacterium]
MLPIITMKDEMILLAHGAGGKHSRLLIEQLILKYFNDPALKLLPDAATIECGSVFHKFFFTTDSFVVNPLFFPGGDIGKLAICGTVNDLAVSGADPLYLSCSLIIEEGFKLSCLSRILKSMAEEARRCNIRIVTGDTKVVERGKCDGLFINTSGIGIKRYSVSLGLERVRPGDAIILSGVPGMHELAIVCARENIKFRSPLKSDCAAINGLISEVLKEPFDIKFMRDPTRGGMASVLNEIASGCNYGLKIYEREIPLTKNVKSLCEILGFDPINLACEGRVVMVVDFKDAQKIISIMRNHPLGRNAGIIGRIVDEFHGKVIMETIDGSERFIRMPSGKQLPRIC